MQIPTFLTLSPRCAVSTKTGCLPEAGPECHGKLIDGQRAVTRQLHASGSPAASPDIPRATAPVDLQPPERIATPSREPWLDRRRRRAIAGPHLLLAAPRRPAGTALAPQVANPEAMRPPFSQPHGQAIYVGRTAKLRVLVKSILWCFRSCGAGYYIVWNLTDLVGIVPQAVACDRRESLERAVPLLPHASSYP